MFYITTDHGNKIAVYDFHPRNQETVLLLHGWPLSHLMYEYQIGLLARLGYRVVALDLRGFGRSDAPASGYHYDCMADDVCRVVQTLGLCRFTLVGFSMGGAIALRYMRRFRGAGVKKLVLLAAAAPCWVQRPDFPYGLPRSQADDLIRLAETDRPLLAQRFSHEQLFASPQSEAAKDWFEDIALSASGLGTVQAAIALRDEDGRRDLAAVQVPAFILHGAKDVVVSTALAEIQQRGIRGAKRITLENSGHGIVYDELERFNRLFLEVLRS